MSNADRPTDLWQATLLRGAAEFGLAPPPEEMEAYRAHLELLLLHNRRAGLTSITIAGTQTTAGTFVSVAAPAHTAAMIRSRVRRPSSRQRRKK